MFREEPTPSGRGLRDAKEREGRRRRGRRPDAPDAQDAPDVIGARDTSNPRDTPDARDTPDPTDDPCFVHVIRPDASETERELCDAGRLGVGARRANESAAANAVPKTHRRRRFEDALTARPRRVRAVSSG